MNKKEPAGLTRLAVCSVFIESIKLYLCAPGMISIQIWPGFQWRVITIGIKIGYAILEMFCHWPNIFTPSRKSQTSPSPRRSSDRRPMTSRVFRRDKLDQNIFGRDLLFVQGINIFGAASRAQVALRRSAVNIFHAVIGIARKIKSNFLPYLFQLRSNSEKNASRYKREFCLPSFQSMMAVANLSDDVKRLCGEGLE